MHKEQAQKKPNRFSTVDLSIDILLLLVTFTVPLQVPDFLSLSAESFFQNLAIVALMAVGYFGFALYVAHMYCATAVKKDKRWTHRVLFHTVPLLLFTGLLGFNLLFSLYNIFFMISVPVFSSLILIVEALAFGFTFGLDYAIERQRTLEPKMAVAFDDTFSQSLTSIPYILLTVIVLFPADYFSLKLEIPIVGRFITLIGTCVLIFVLSNRLNKSIFSKLRLSAIMSLTTVMIVSLLMIIGFLGFGALELFARHHIEFINSSQVWAVVYLILFGIVPIRIGSILFSKTKLVNKIIGLVAVGSYLLIEGRIINLSWKF